MADYSACPLRDAAEYASIEIKRAACDGAHPRPLDSSRWPSAGASTARGLAAVLGRPRPTACSNGARGLLTADGRNRALAHAWKGSRYRYYVVITGKLVSANSPWRSRRAATLCD